MISTFKIPRIPLLEPLQISWRPSSPSPLCLKCPPASWSVPNSSMTVPGIEPGYSARKAALPTSYSLIMGTLQPPVSSARWTPPWQRTLPVPSIVNCHPPPPRLTRPRRILARLRHGLLNSAKAARPCIRQISRKKER
uniref:Uncharacterized protein n=1 Tax=Cacopsylla melanoneura TaxID=428564 RepID=A0A8D8MDL1_9HEMI